MSVDQRTAALKKVYWLERDAIGLAMVSSTDSSADYISVNEVKEVTIHAVKLDEDFVATGTGITMTESPAIPAEFHEALANYAIAKGYELKPELIRQAGYFRSLFNEDVREGKKYANKGRDGTAYSIQGTDY